MKQSGMNMLCVGNEITEINTIKEKKEKN